MSGYLELCQVILSYVRLSRVMSGYVAPGPGMLERLERSDRVPWELLSSSCSRVKTASAYHWRDTLICILKLKCYLALEFVNESSEVFDKKWPQVNEEDPVHHNHNEAVPGRLDQCT